MTPSFFLCPAKQHYQIAFIFVNKKSEIIFSSANKKKPTVK